MNPPRISEKPASRPAVAVHQGRLWMIWLDASTNRITSSVLDSTGESWTGPIKWDVPGQACGSPAIAEFQGVLHLAYTQEDDGKLVHMTFNDIEQSLETSGFVMNATSTGHVSLAEFDDKLFCVYGAHDNNLHYACFDPKTGWSDYGSTGHSTHEDHDLCVVDGAPWLLYTVHDDRNICYRTKFQEYGGKWSPATEMGELTSVGFSWETFNYTTVTAFKSNHSEQEMLPAENTQADHLVPDDPSLETKIEIKPSFGFFNPVAIGLLPLPIDASADSNVLDSPKPSIASNSNWGADLRSWMGILPNNRNVTQLTIPGTHDSHATWANVEWHRKVIGQFVVCQHYGIFRQMELGVRYIDLRVTSDLRMCHGPILLWGTLDKALNEIREFLRFHPTETALVSVKWDDGSSSEKIAITVANWWEANNWYRDNRWPTLGEVRGKLVLLKRFDDHHRTPSGYGIDWRLFGNKSMPGPAPWDQQDEGTKAGMERFKRWELAAMNIRRVKELPIDDGVMHFTTLADADSTKAPSYYATFMKVYEYWPKTMNELTIDPNSRRFGIICWDYLDESIGNTIVQKNF
ncbi:hypothetical protein AK830_g1313 [Neonectria ditissima]|uniref:Phosphatidylinositol-specific phospholipase C X domain-containing protein n=1 Tax=Neonectria ditissima TaxID=78410 RepID=A0A0P7BZJ2_9HYPO|nr:hypothetical protein AK830_g1313 [Neonectria ditissima]